MAVSRPTILLAAIAAIALSMLYLVRPVAATEPFKVYLQASHAGADSSTFKEDEDCGDFTSGVVWHFILNNYDGSGTAHLVATFDGAGVLETDASKVLNSVQHFYLNTPTDDVLDSDNLNTYAEVADEDLDANLVLSHVCHTGNEQSQSQSQSEEQSVSEAQSASQTPEESVEAGTGTPAESVPDGAMSFIGSNPIATLAFGLILLASLAGLAFANVKSARSRS
jgi:hypothetical protein